MRIFGLAGLAICALSGCTQLPSNQNFGTTETQFPGLALIEAQQVVDDRIDLFAANMSASRTRSLSGGTRLARISIRDDGRVLALFQDGSLKETAFRDADIRDADQNGAAVGWSNAGDEYAFVRHTSGTHLALEIRNQNHAFSAHHGCFGLLSR